MHFRTVVCTYPTQKLTIVALACTLSFNYLANTTGAFAMVLPIARKLSNTNLANTTWSLATVKKPNEKLFAMLVRHTARRLR